ncbi:polyamine aminopropyltransferase [bacterium]|nr:polyamine aminopropyltransferase [bacterium]
MTQLEKRSNHSPKALVIVLGISMLFVGICGISYEYTFSRLASDIMGNSVKQWAIIIGLMMLFMGIGADLQKYFPDKYNVDNFIILEILLGLMGGIGPSITLYAFGSLHAHFIIIHYFFICSIGLMIGLEIPLLSRINEITVPSLKHNLGMILKMDYIGSFIGALVWVFILPRFFNMLEISIFLGIINVCVAIFTWLWFKNWMQHPKMVFMLAILVLATLIIGLVNGKKVTLTAEQKLYNDPIVFTKTTPYQRIVITKSHSDDVYLYINGHFQFASIDEHIYHEFLVHPLMAAAQNRKRVLVLGGGDGMAVREILKYSDVESITLVDIDPEMTTLASTHPELVRMNQGSLQSGKIRVLDAAGVTEGEEFRLEQYGQGFFRKDRVDDDIKVHVFNLDAYKFIESIPGLYDIIIIDFPDPNSLELAKLFSLEFYAKLKKRLAFNGLLVQQSSTPALAKEVFLTIGRTMEAAGYSASPIHHLVPSFGDWGWWIAGHKERFGKNGLRQQIEKGADLPEDVKYITRELTNSSFYFGKNSLTTENKDINTVLNKRIYEYYLQEMKKLR